MGKQGIKETLKNHKCLTCNNLAFWDWYLCMLDKHTDKNGYLCMNELKECDGYTKRKGYLYKDCKEEECIFWCNDCPTFLKNNEERSDNND